MHILHHVVLLTTWRPSSFIPSRLHSYSFVACVGTTPTYWEYVSVAILLVASLYF